LKKVTQNGVSSLSFKSSDSRSNDLNHILSGGNYSYFRGDKVNKKSSFNNISYFNSTKKQSFDKRVVKTTKFQPESFSVKAPKSKSKSKSKSPKLAKKTSTLCFNTITNNNIHINAYDNTSTYDITLNSDGNISNENNKEQFPKTRKKKNIENYNENELDLFCCICQWKFPIDLTDNEINVHTNLCLDGKGEENKKNHLLNSKRLYDNNDSFKGVVKKSMAPKIKI